MSNAIAKAIHEGLYKIGTVVMYCGAFEKIVEQSIAPLVADHAAKLEQAQANERRYLWLRSHADSVIDWDFMPPCSHEFSPLENGCSNTLDHATDLAIAAGKGAGDSAS